MEFKKYFKKNKNKYGIVGSEFILKVESFFDADIEGKKETIIAGYIRPSDRDGETIGWQIFDGNLVLDLTKEEEKEMKNSPEMKRLDVKFLKFLNERDEFNNRNRI